MYLYEVTHHFTSATLHVLAEDTLHAIHLAAAKLVEKGHTNNGDLAVGGIHSVTELYSIDAGLPETE